MMTAARSPLEWALSQVGVREATGHNDGIPAERYADGEEIPWCAAFVRWCFEQSGIRLPGNRWKIRAVAEMFAQLKLFDAEISFADAEPGDIVFFSRDHRDAGATGHVGIIEWTNHGRAIFGTVEGNAGNAVTRRRYTFTHPRIIGFCRWDGSKQHWGVR